MKTKIVLLLAVLAVGVNAISSYSPYKIYQQTDTLTHSNLDSNLLRGSNWSSQLVDTLDKKFIRFTDVKDSTFQKVNVDTIRGNPNVDSIAGNTIHSGSPTVTGTLSTDSLKSTKGISTPTLNTGNGDVECYAQNQNLRTTDNVTHNRMTVTDSTYSPAIRGLRLYVPQAGIDSLVGDVDVGGDVFVDEDFVGRGTRAMLRPNTGDGTDNKGAVLSGGGTNSTARGGFVDVWGNENGTPGLVRLMAGVGDGTTTGMINLGSRTLFGSDVNRPSNDSYWQAAFGKYFTLYGADENESYLIHNAYYSSGWKYRESTVGAGANLITIGGGAFNFNVAGDGTKDAAISFTPGLKITNTGSVLIGSSGTPSAKFHVINSVAAQNTALIDASANGTGKGLLINANTRATADTATKALEVVNYVNASSFSVSIGGGTSIGGNLNGTTATFTGTVNADSLKSTKGINATTGTFSGRVTGASIGATTGTFAGACTTATINTGHGNFEVGQSTLTTSDVTFDSLKLTDLKVTDDATIDDDLAVGGDVNITGGLQFDSGDLITVYDTGSFPCSLLTECVTTQDVGIATYVVVGNFVTIKFPELEGESNSTILRIRCATIPSSILPTDITRTMFFAKDNTTTYLPCYISNLYHSSTYIDAIPIGSGVSGFTSSGTKGIRTGTIIHYIR